jgi:phage-related protein
MITRLAAPTNKAKDAMAELGIEAYDSEGNMRSMNDIAVELQGALFGTSEATVEVGGRTRQQNKDLAALQKQYDKTAQRIHDYKIGVLGVNLTEDKRAGVIADLNEELAAYQGRMEPLQNIQGEMATQTLPALTEQERAAALEAIFGADAFRAAAAMAESGAVAYTDQTKAAEELGVEYDVLTKYMDGGITHFEALQAQMEGTSAAENAATRMDNLAGAMEILGGIVEAVKIKIGDAFLPVVRKVVEAVSEFVEENGDKIEGFFKIIADVIDAFVTGSPGDYPWDEILPPWLAGTAQTIADAVQAVMDAVESGEGVFESVMAGMAELGIDESILQKIREFGAALKEFFVDNKDAIVDGLKAVGIAVAGFAGLTVLATIGGILASMVNPLTLILALIGVLAAAWSGDWGGMRTKLTEFWEDIYPKLEALGETIATTLEPAVTFVRDFIGWLKQGKDIDVAFFHALDTVHVPEETMAKLAEFRDIIESLAGYFQAVWEDGDTLNDFLSDLPEPIQPVIEAWGEFLAKLKETGESIKEFVNEQGAKISEWVEENRPLIEEFARVVGGALGTAIGVLAFIYAKVYTIILGLWNVIEPILGGIVDLFLGLVKAIMQIVTGDWEGAWETIKETAGKVWVALQEAAVAFIEWIMSWFGTTWEGFVLMWQEAWEGLKAKVAEVWEGIKEAISAAWTGLMEWFAEVWLGMQETWATFWQSLHDKVAEIWEGIKQFLIDIIRSIVEAMGLDWETFKEDITQIWNDIELIAQELWNRITTWIATKVEEIRLAIATKIEEAKAKWEEVWTAVSEFLTPIWETISTFISTKIEEVRTAITGKLEETKTDWGTKWDEIKAKVEEIWEAIKTGVSTKLEEVKTAVSEKIGEAKEAILTFVQPFTEAGSEIINGVKEGIVEAAGGLVQAAIDAVQGALQGAKEFLGIASPSKEFANLGDFAIQGLIQGLQNSQAAAAQAAEGMAQALLVNLTASLKRMGVQIQADLAKLKMLWDLHWQALILLEQANWLLVNESIKQQMLMAFTTIESNLALIMELWKTHWELIVLVLKQQWELLLVELKKKLNLMLAALLKALKDAYTMAKSEASRFVSIGAAMVNGMISGVRSRAGALAAAAAAAAAAAFAAAQAEIDSHSPSKKFAKLGVWSMEGFMLGFKQMTGQLVKTTGGLGFDVQRSFAEGMARIRNGLGGAAVDIARSNIPLPQTASYGTNYSGGEGGEGGGRNLHVYGDVYITTDGDAATLFEDLQGLE